MSGSTLLKLLFFIGHVLFGSNRSHMVVIFLLGFTCLSEVYMKFDGMVQGLIAVGFLLGVGMSVVGFLVYELLRHVHIQFV